MRIRWRSHRGGNQLCYVLLPSTGGRFFDRIFREGESEVYMLGYFFNVVKLCLSLFPSRSSSPTLRCDLALRKAFMIDG